MRCFNKIGIVECVKQTKIPQEWWDAFVELKFEQSVGKCVGVGNFGNVGVLELRRETTLRTLDVPPPARLVCTSVHAYVQIHAQEASLAQIHVSVDRREEDGCRNRWRCIIRGWLLRESPIEMLRRTQ